MLKMTRCVQSMHICLQNMFCSRTVDPLHNIRLHTEPPRYA